MPRFSIEKSFRRGSILSAYPHHLAKCNPHLTPSLCNQEQKRDVGIPALMWTWKGRYFACFGSPSISKGSKIVAHLIIGKKKQLSLSIISATLHTEGQDTEQDKDVCFCSWEPLTNYADHRAVAANKHVWWETACGQAYCQLNDQSAGFV